MCANVCVCMRVCLDADMHLYACMYRSMYTYCTYVYIGLDKHAMLSFHYFQPSARAPRCRGWGGVGVGLGVDWLVEGVGWLVLPPRTHQQPPTTQMVSLVVED